MRVRVRVSVRVRVRVRLRVRVRVRFRVRVRVRIFCHVEHLLPHSPVSRSDLHSASGANVPAWQVVIMLSHRVRIGVGA